jgi:hypothetical protein
MYDNHEFGRRCPGRASRASTGRASGGNNPILVVAYGIGLFGADRRRCGEAAMVVDIERFPDAAEEFLEIELLRKGSPMSSSGGPLIRPRARTSSRWTLGLIEQFSLYVIVAHLHAGATRVGLTCGR